MTLTELYNEVSRRADTDGTKINVASSEIGPDGLVYLLSLSSRKLNEFVTAPVIKVFKVKK